jgi:hypothetical protein
LAKGDQLIISTVVERMGKIERKRKGSDDNNGKVRFSILVFV